MTSKVQSSMVVSLARAKGDSDTRVTTRTRQPTPPWTPSATSCFSRPTPPPLAAFRCDVAGAHKAKPAPATLPPPPLPAVCVSLPASTPVPEPAPVSVIVNDPSSAPMLASLFGALSSSKPTSNVTAVARVTRGPALLGTPRRGIALGFGVAASLLLAIGLATPSGSPRTAQAAAQVSRSLAADLGGAASALAQWTSSRQPSEAMQEPAPAGSTTADPMPPSGELLALAVANPLEAATPGLEPAPQPRRSRRARHRAHDDNPVAAQTTPEPEPEPRRTSSRRQRPASAKQMLWDGEVALALGDAEGAYRLAKRSRDTGARSEAASLVARSACRVGERDAAKKALRDIPLVERGAVRRDCRRNGSRIGL